MNASCPCPSLRPVDGTPRVLVRLQRYSRASTGIHFLQMQTMRKNWVDILYWCGKLQNTVEDCGHRVSHAIGNILDRLVTRKLLEYHFMNPDHGHAMELEVEDANKEKTMKQFPPHSLVHADWGM